MTKLIFDEQKKKKKKSYYYLKWEMYVRGVLGLLRYNHKWKQNTWIVEIRNDGSIDRRDT